MTRDELLAEISRAVRYAFPDRAEQILWELEKRVAREDSRDLDRHYPGVARDRLTRAWSRRAARFFLEMEIARRRDEPVPLSVLMVDLDRLMRVNAEHGHVVGDSVLVSVARTISGAVRPSDIVTRFGGEEFLVLLPETAIETAAEIAERVRAEIERTPIAFDGGTLRITASIGVAAVPGPSSVGERVEDTYDAVLRTAEDRLHAAKASGRNRVVSLG